VKGTQPDPNSPTIELLWFDGCPNHLAAEALVREVMDQLGIIADIHRREVPDESIGILVGFPGSPTIRVNGQDVEPGFTACDDCTPRCRVYFAEGRMTGLPAREWVVAALRTLANKRDSGAR